jgi:hypothetical protein
MVGSGGEALVDYHHAKEPPAAAQHIQCFKLGVFPGAGFGQGGGEQGFFTYFRVIDLT